MSQVINIAKDYTTTPGGRYRAKGPFSGEDFRESILIPKFQEACKKGETLTVNFDGGFGYSTSFLEEAFGGLVRRLRDSRVQNIILISQDEPSVILKVTAYIQEALQKLGR